MEWSKYDDCIFKRNNCGSDGEPTDSGCKDIGYLIYISGRDAANMPGRGEEVKIHTYLNVKEDGPAAVWISLGR